jgi:DNA polymerase-2
MVKFPSNKILIFDIETDSTDTEKASLKYFGAYSYLTKERYYISSEETYAKEMIQEMFDNHDYLVGFNIKRYDLPILNRHGVFFRDKVIVDLWEVLSEPRLDPKTRIRSGGKGRGEFMGLDLDSWSLASIVKALNLGEYKTEGFNYELLKKTSFSPEEKNYIIGYLAQDITVTKRLFEYTHNFFYPLSELLNEWNVKRMTYVTASIASLAYKVLCAQAKVEETYGEGEKDWEVEGGYVRLPTKEEYIGETIVLDFASLYPSIFRAFNLFSPADKDYPSVFTGNDFFSIKGRYKADKLGVFETVIAQLYQMRKEYKKNKDRRQYLIKIIINALYGISPKPIFEKVFNRYAAEDCTSLGRQMIKYAADKFNEQDYEVLYGDTDSLFIALKSHTKEDALKLANDLNEFFKSKMPFPHNDFGLSLDKELSAIFFIPFEDGTFKKKNYIYITKDDKIEIKGLPIIKSNASKIATKILNEHLISQIIANKKIKFPVGYLKQLIYYELNTDITIAEQVYKVKTAAEYDGVNGLHAQIAKQYGPGVHRLITNNKFGIGMDKKYCTIEEFYKNKLRIQDVDLSTTLNNLSPFTQNEQRELGDY